MSPTLFDVADSWWVATALLSIRVAPVFAMTPLLTTIGVPLRVRVFLVLGLSAALVAGMPSAAIGALPSGFPALVLAAMLELALGVTLSLGVLLAFGAFSVAGRLLDVQVGFGMAQVYDPASQRQLSVLTSAFNVLAVLVFFLVNGHHALLRGLAYSLERFPLGAPWPIDAAGFVVIKQVGGLFSLGFALAAPVVFCLLLVELALGVVARNLPQMNIFTVGFPVKIIVGLAALSIWFAGIGGTMTRVYGGIYQAWGELFAVDAVAAPSAERG